MRYPIFIVFFIFYTACEQKSTSKPSLEKITFKTRSDTELFFKNLRSIYYDFEEQEKTKLHFYRFKNRPKTSNQVDLSLIIVHNWRFNEAYLLIDSAIFLPHNQPFSLISQNPRTKQKTEIRFEGGDKKAHFDLAQAVYSAILKEEIFFLVNKNAEIPVLQSKSAREAFRITVKDYLRLIGSL